MGSSRGKQKENKAEARVDQAYAEYKPSPLEEMRTKRTMKFLQDFEGGKDVKDIEALSPYLNLFNNAKNSQSNQMVGRGAVALANPGAANQVSDLDKYVQAQREQDASGMLYNAANEGYQDAVSESGALMNMDQQRKAGRLGFANQQYHTVMNRPQRIPLWERLLKIGASAGTSIASGGMGGGGVG